jgi:diaminohydroxyphosphoribosylaminopyrimidine deaminase/5-amino-6-(5-phosphoribosylamino)uracil reductase
MFSERDRSFMARALALAERGLETTQPNPRVGCVIARAGKIVGEGWHERAGEAHAEVNALRQAGEQTAGATAYVTLEPCAHHGRTPPCVDALIAARLARVVFAGEDPDPRVSGQGAEALRRAGIAVDRGLLEAEAAELNPGFLKRMRTGRPWVRLKSAISLDGRTALASGASQWITGAAAREDAQHWRARSSAVLTGIGTVLADDPRLDVRLPDRVDGAKRPQPLRVVLDASLRMPPTARMLATGAGVLVLTAAGGPANPAVESRRSRLRERGALIEELPVSADGARLDLAAVLDLLGRREINELMVEAGPRLSGELLERRLVDELLVYLAPKLLGPQARALAELDPIGRLEDAREFTVTGMRQIGADVRLTLRPR